MSARVASPAASGSRMSDPVRALQHALYRAAKADPGRWLFDGTIAAPRPFRGLAGESECRR